MIKRAGSGAVAAADTTIGQRRRRSRAETDVRFPCGHREPEAAVMARTSERGHAIWVSCRRCNVLVVVVAGEA